MSETESTSAALRRAEQERDEARAGRRVVSDFQERGEALRRRYGIDGTAGDAQDVPHPFHRDQVTGACLVCGLAEGYRKHRDQP